MQTAEATDNRTTDYKADNRELRVDGRVLSVERVGN
jgi:hypothetical protein